jgi:hypothetical protein
VTTKVYDSKKKKISCSFCKKKFYVYFHTRLLLSLEYDLMDFDKIPFVPMGTGFFAVVAVLIVFVM